MKKIIIVMLILCVGALGFYAVKSYMENAKYNRKGFASGNGRLEATEISVAAKLAGRLEKVYVEEGALVRKGDKLALMQLNVLEAELAQAKAQKLECEAQLGVKESELTAAQATLKQKQSSFAGAEKRFKRHAELKKQNTISTQEYENAETNYLTSQAELAAAAAGVKQSEAEIEAAKANIKVADAKIARVQADIDDSLLNSPCRGRVQYRVAEPGEVLQSGAGVINLVDMHDVYMTFFLPETLAGKVKIGAAARIVLDALPEVAIPATISYVSSVAQFTPKTVETKEERQKLMFRIKAKIAPELLEKYVDYIKTGLPGEAWVQLDPNAQWPEFLMLKSEREQNVK